MQSHASQIQAILARERDEHGRRAGIVRASLQIVPPRPQGIAAAGAGARPSR